MRLGDDEFEQLLAAVAAHACGVLRSERPLGTTATPAELRERAGQTITADGIGAEAALRIYRDVLAPACLSAGHPRFLAFVPAAPTEAAILSELAIVADNIYAGSWLEGAGAVFAENEALRWIADLAGFPPGAGGVFLSGGTAGNLSALIAARARWRHRAAGTADRIRPLFLTAAGAHSSIAQAARVMDADLRAVPADEGGRLHGAALRAVLDELAAEDRDRVCAVVATAGTTNAGVIDDLAGVAEICEAEGIWLHVDGAYGAAALAAPSRRERFVGIERADSLIVDPHKWLFAPYDSCALLYRDPAIAKAAHTQQAEYLEILQESGPEGGNWNPSDYAHHLSRRARGLAFWFSLATYGTAAYVEAVEVTLRCAEQAAESIRRHSAVELILEPELSVVLLRRPGWAPEDYRAWSAAQREAGTCFVVPTTWQDETVLRLCIVNPATSVADIDAMLDTLLDLPA